VSRGISGAPPEAWSKETPGAVRSQIVRDQRFRQEAIFLQKLAHEFQRGALAPFRLDQHIEDLAFGVDCAPQIDHAAIDFQIDFV
jgi:hypothetical protein